MTPQLGDEIVHWFENSGDQFDNQSGWFAGTICKYNKQEKDFDVKYWSDGLVMGHQRLDSADYSKQWVFLMVTDDDVGFT